jgi:hypothetical protein
MKLKDKLLWGEIPFHIQGSAGQGKAWQGTARQGLARQGSYPFNLQKGK